jgi:hypothetical protein
MYYPYFPGDIFLPKTLRYIASFPQKEKDATYRRIFEEFDREQIAAMAIQREREKE